jgi:hypothetical protein
LGGAQQSAEQIEQRRLTRAVLSQQSVDAVFFQCQTEIIKYQMLRSGILETDVLYFYHIRLLLIDNGIN